MLAHEPGSAVLLPRADRSLSLACSKSNDSGWLKSPLEAKDRLSIVNTSISSPPSTLLMLLPRNPRNEKAVYDPLIEAIDRGNRCPSVRFCNSSDAPEDSSSLDFKPSELSLSDEQNVRSDVVTTLFTPGKAPERKSPTGMVDSESSELATVSSQRTRTHEFFDAAWVCKCLPKNLDTRVFRHTHCRVVLKQAGYSLRTFTGSRELFGAARDALQALDSAYKRCRRVHRDISLDNIILYRSEPLGLRRGLLVDWEFSSVVDLTGKVADDLRSGTWAYMSGNALYDPEGFRHTIDDDLESLFYVVMYGSIRWLPHNYVSRLGRWMHTFFDEVGVDADGQTIGGSKKLLQIAFSGSRFLGLFKFENRFVQDWFKVGYKLLGTTSDTSKNSGQTCLWTMEKLQELLAIVCEGLARMDDTKRDRREHELEDYTDTKAESQGTRISLFAAARNFRESHRQPESFRKRSSDEAFEDDTETRSSRLQVSERRRGKQRRVVHRDDDDIARDRAKNEKRAISKRHGDERRRRRGVTEDSDVRRIGSGSGVSRQLGRRVRSLSSQGTRRSPRLKAKLTTSRSAPSR
ncbi:hypothetical protein ACEPAI_9688 [Sanghuangporus weigelae]